MKEFFKRIDALFIGRKTYEMFMKTNSKEEDKGPFSKMKQYVFSTTLTEVKPKLILIRGDIKNEVSKITQQPGKDIWLFGGAGQATSFLNEGLIDEIGLAVHPIILGGGKPLFNDIRNRVKLKLTDTRTYSSGLVSLTYKVLH